MAVWRPTLPIGSLTAGAVEGVLSIVGRTAKSTGKEGDFEAELQKTLDGHVRYTIREIDIYLFLINRLL